MCDYYNGQWTKPAVMVVTVVLFYFSQVMSQKYEDECIEYLTKDDKEILEKRFKCYEMSVGKSKKPKFQSQWTRYHDAVQEHFSSHVTINSNNFVVAKNIYLLKASSKHSWMLYKKRECERRKRLRKKITIEKQKEQSGAISNMLLSMVDSCESCKKFYVTVNLFWGITLCDICYFNEDVIKNIMLRRKENFDTQESIQYQIAQTNINLDRVNKTKKTKAKGLSKKEKDEYFKPVLKESDVNRDNYGLSSESEEKIIEEDCDTEIKEDIKDSVINDKCVNNMSESSGSESIIMEVNEKEEEREYSDSEFDFLNIVTSPITYDFYQSKMGSQSYDDNDIE